MSLFDITIDGVSAGLIHRALRSYRDKWPGGDPQEQLNLERLEMEFKRMVLEFQLETTE